MNHGNLPAIPGDSTNEIDATLALIESRTLRAQHVERTDILDKVKALLLLPDNTHATTEIVAGYFAVPISTIKSVVEDNRAELEANGYRVLSGEELKEFAGLFEGPANPVGPRTRSLALFERRTMVNLGMLLKGSPVARQLRTALMDIEESVAPEVKAHIVANGPLPLREQAEIIRILFPMLPEAYATAKVKLLAARVLGEEPEIDPAEMPLYASVFLEEKGHKRKTLDAFESRFGLRCSNRYLKVHGKRPAKVAGPATSAHIKTINVYAQADRPILEAVYEELASEFAAFESGLQAAA